MTLVGPVRCPLDDCRCLIWGRSTHQHTDRYVLRENLSHHLYTRHPLLGQRVRSLLLDEAVKAVAA